MGKCLIPAIRSIGGMLALLLVTNAALAQGIPDDRNINIIGSNPPVADGSPDTAVPDTGLKQQNEPACGMKPSNPLHIICAFNDYRGVDDPAIGDAWEGYAYSINGGQTWVSDLLPGHPGDTSSVGLEFAADAQVSTAPGVALVSYIAANRGDVSEDGGLFLQRLFEVNREAGAPWEPEMFPLQVASGGTKKFIDKPFKLLHPASADSGTVLLNATLKDGTPITREVPAASIFLARTEFFSTGTATVVTVSKSDDYGATWATSSLSTGNSINQSASLAANGDTVCAVWRRFESTRGGPIRGSKQKQNEPPLIGRATLQQQDRFTTGRASTIPDAIMVNCSTDRGDNWGKATELVTAPDFFPFDQATSENTFRVNSYPVIATDGTKFYAFWASRKAAISPFFARIEYSTSVDGSAWTAPVILEDAVNGHQFMPAVASAAGTIQIAWYDTRNNLFQDVFIQDLLDDTVDPPESVIRNTGDVRTAQIINGIATASTQVSRYTQGAKVDDGPVEQLEFNFLNDRLFQTGTVPFPGDYLNVAAPAFRVEDGQWVSNTPPTTQGKPVDFLISWTDNRDVRGNVWEDLNEPTVYTPANVTVAMAAAGYKASAPSDDTDVNTETESALQLADLDRALTEPTDATGDETSPQAANVADKESVEATADGVADPTAVYPECIADDLHRDRTRNQNVYSSVVRPGVSLENPSASKPNGSIQRAHVIWISNNTEAPATYTLTIDNQPPDAPVLGRASFLQVPVAPFSLDDGGLLETIDVFIKANSTVARTVFVTSQIVNPPINVSVSDGGAMALGTITINPDVPTPDIQNPDILNPGDPNPDIQTAEVHNPDIQNVVISRVANPNVRNPDIQNPDIQNPDIQNADYQNPDIQNPDIQNPDIQNSTLAASGTDNPDLENDTLTPAQRAAGLTDVTFEATNNGNTTTSFDLDAVITGDTTGLSTQLIATRRHETETSRNCQQGKLVQSQVIFNEIDPDLNPGVSTRNSGTAVYGDGSAYLAPGETVFVTLRVWADPATFDVDTASVVIRSQSCNTEDKGPGTITCDPPFSVGSPTTIPTITSAVITGDLSILNDGHLVAANNLGDDAATVEVNGVQFGNDQTGQSGFLNGAGDFSTDPFSPQLDTLLSNLIAVEDDDTDAPSGSFTIDGLIPGVDYRLQLLLSNDVNDTGNNIEISVQGETFILNHWQPDAVNVIVEFVAANSSVVMEFNAGDDAGYDAGRGILNAYALHAFGLDVPPVIVVPDSPYLVEAFNVEGTIVGYDEILVTASDDIDTDVLIECSTDAESVSGLSEITVAFDFPGALTGAVATDVTCSATDSGGNSAEEIFSLVVEDTIAPVIYVNEDYDGETDFLFYADDPAYQFAFGDGGCTNPDGCTFYQVFYQGEDPADFGQGGPTYPRHVYVYDDVDFGVEDTLECEPPSGSDEAVFPPDNEPHPVTCTAIDANGNEAEEQFNVVPLFYTRKGP
ncbi:MAG: hypothetical protein HKN70_06395 [Gammaproteobacteria bacterium]|nr:hypothetical protein [Gammaproteobacteria bacterium]